MTRAIRGIIRRAAAEFAQDGVVSADIQAELVAEGYVLTALDQDIQDLLDADGLED